MKTLRLFLFVIGIVCSVSASSQALRDINYSYLYDGSSGFYFSTKPIRQNNGWTVFYRIHFPDSTYSAGNFSIQWEKREQLSDKEGTPLADQPIVLTTTNKGVTGKFTIGLSASQQLIVAKVTNNSTKKLWVFYSVLVPDYSINSFLQFSDGSVIFDPYVNLNKSFLLQGFADGESLLVSYYSHKFPTAAPAFSEGQARVNQAIKPDSLFTLTSGQKTSFDRKGLYLVQKDTASLEGLAFRAEDGYPKFKHLQDLVGPFIYVCAKDEYDRLRMSGNDKKQFDKSVLAITHDAERAREFMKTYFTRAEIANHLFTSYKEGWKSDRGMIYLIYGAPEKVYKFIDREVWSYGKTDFNFAKSSTLFDPDNYVLIRNKKYTDEWYEKVDLIRNSRF